MLGACLVPEHAYVDTAAARRCGTARNPSSAGPHITMYPHVAVPKDKQTYTITSWTMQSGTGCLNKYLSAPSCANGVRPIFQDVVAGFNKDWTFHLVPGTNTYYISSYVCKTYLSAQSCDGGTEIYLSNATAGPNQQFQLVPTVRSTAQKGEYTFKAVARAGACKEWMGLVRNELQGPTGTLGKCPINVDLQSPVEYIAGGHSGGSDQAFWVTP